MKNKILQEQKLMLSLIDYDRGLSSFENQQLNEWSYVEDAYDATVNYLSGKEGFIPDALQSGDGVVATYLRGESGVIPGDQTELKKDIKSAVSKVDKVLDTNLLNWAKGNEGLIPDFGGVGTTEMVKNGFNSAAEWIASIDWADVAHVALPILEIGLWIATPICPVCPFLAAGAGMADAVIYAKQGDWKTAGVAGALSLLPGVGAIVKKIPGIKTLGKKGMQTLANKITKMSKGEKVPLSEVEKTVVAALKDPAIQQSIKPAFQVAVKEGSKKALKDPTILQRLGNAGKNAMTELSKIGLVGYGGYKTGEAYAQTGAAGPKALLMAKGYNEETMGEDWWNQIKVMFGASGSKEDGELLVQAIKAGWEPGTEVPREFRTEKFNEEMAKKQEDELSSEEHGSLMAKYGLTETVIKESTSTTSSGSYETPMAWQSGGELTQSPREEIMSVELGIELPSEVDITGGNIGGFNDVETNVCSTCGQCHEGPCDFSEIPETIDNEVVGDVLPDSLLNLFGDIHIGGDLEIELDENPKKLRGARKFRR